MPPYDDVYVLAPARDRGVIDRFLSRFASTREESAADYVVPLHPDVPARVFHSAGELIAHCLANQQEPHQVYWRCPDGGDPAHAMVFFTEDGGLILGLSVSEGAGPRWLAQMHACAGSTVGCVLLEEPPPDTVAGFLALAASLGGR
jgi:hypothetical protein